MNITELIDRGNFDPKQLDSETLLSYHYELHKLWIMVHKGVSVEGFTKENIFQLHGIAAEEMTKRELQVDEDGNHASPLPDLSENSIELSKSLFNDLEMFDIILRPKHNMATDSYEEKEAERISNFYAHAELDTKSEIEFEKFYSASLSQMGDNNFIIHKHLCAGKTHYDMRFRVENHLIGFILENLKLEDNRVLAKEKVNQSLDWLNVKGEIKQGKAGAVDGFPAKFDVVDKGSFEFGAQTESMLEVFLDGKIMKGRFLFEKQARPSDNNNAGKQPFVWLAHKPKKKRPYVFSTRALKKGFVPPKGKSALSKEWRDMIPNALQWWTKNWTGTHALTAIKEVRTILLKRSVLSIDMINFTLQQDKDSWILSLSNGTIIDLTKNPLECDRPIEAKLRQLNPKDMNTKGVMIDKGKLHKSNPTDHFMSLNFSGSKLKGFWTATKKEEKWILQRKEQIKTKRLDNTKLTNVQLSQIKSLSEIGYVELSDICRIVGCSKSTVMYQQRKMGFR